MMGRLKSEQAQLFYQFELGDAVPEDHLVRRRAERGRPPLRQMCDKVRYSANDAQLAFKRCIEQKSVHKVTQWPMILPRRACARHAEVLQ
jgi:hypothetical protein